MSKVTRSNPKAFETLNLRLKELAGIQVKVGWFAGKEYEDGTPVAYVAALNELGHGPTPPRPFIRPTMTAQKENWAQIAAYGAKQVLKGSDTVYNVMDQLGNVVETDILQAINTLTTPPLSPITIQLRAMKKKDSDLKVTGATVGEAAAIVSKPGYQKPTGVSGKPLNDSGFMISALTHVTEKK